MKFIYIYVMLCLTIIHSANLITCFVYCRDAKRVQYCSYAPGTCRKSPKRAALKYQRGSGNDYLSGSCLRSWWHLPLKAYVKFDDTETRKYLTLREKSKQDRRFVLKTIQCGWSI